MSDKITYYWKLCTSSFSIPLEIFGYRLSIGLWLRLTKDSVSHPQNSEKNCFENEYRYSCLPGARTMRVLELFPGRYDDPISGRLSIVSLDAAVNQYEALSYVWGEFASDLSRTETISLGTGNLRIMPNLQAALRSLRSDTDTRTMWVDALCIDQSNIHERGDQVALMAEIYSNANAVLVWLGSPTAYSLLGIQVLSFLAGEEEFDDNAPWNRTQHQEIAFALSDILERKYFRRIWVVQEAALGRRIQMQVGKMNIHWTSGQHTRRFLARIKLAEISPSWQHPLAEIDFRPLSELLEQSLANSARQNRTIERPTLLDTVHAMSHREASDSRDKIYALMGLATPADVAGMVPDYSLSWEETYRRFYRLIEERILSNPSAGLEDV